MHIDPFGVEIWMNAHETRCTLNLAETCVESLTIGELMILCGRNEGDLSTLLGMKMTYGEIEGSVRLRTAIAGLYARQAVENTIVTHGTIGANMLVHRALVGAGDRVVSIVPTYQQHQSIPASLGAEVAELRLREEDGWLPDMEALAELCTPGTKLIALTNPNNPTGALIDEAGLRRIAEIADAAGAWVLCDEVYRGTDQEGAGMTAAMCDLYGRGISTGGMSKAYSLAGLRLGWVAGPLEVIRAVMIHRDYDTISVGIIDDHFAAMALENRDRVLARAQSITRGNLGSLSDWIDTQPLVSFVRPRSGTVALIRVDVPVTSEAFCTGLLAETGVLLTPGSAFGMEGYVRIGYANSPEILQAGLAAMGDYLRRF